MARNSLLCADVPLRNYSLTILPSYIEPFNTSVVYPSEVLRNFYYLLSLSTATNLMSARSYHCVAVTSLKLFQMLAAVSLFFIFISITSFCLKTHPAMRVTTIIVRRTSFRHQLDRSPRNVSNVDHRATVSVSKRRDEPHTAFFYVDSVCNAWFAVEVIVRLVTSPRPWQLLRSPHNLIDMTATLSFYLDIILTRLQVDRSGIACSRIVSPRSITFFVY